MCVCCNPRSPWATQYSFSYPNHWTVFAVCSAALLGTSTPLHAPLISTGVCARYGAHAHTHTHTHTHSTHKSGPCYILGFSARPQTMLCATHLVHILTHIIDTHSFTFSISEHTKPLTPKKKCAPWSHLISGWMRSMKHPVWLGDEFT